MLELRDKSSPQDTFCVRAVTVLISYKYQLMEIEAFKYLSVADIVRPIHEIVGRREETT